MAAVLLVFIPHKMSEFEVRLKPVYLWIRYPVSCPHRAGRVPASVRMQRPKK